MTNIMFEIPSNPKIEKCIITKETVQNAKEPEVIIDENRKIEKGNELSFRKMKPDEESA